MKIIRNIIVLWSLSLSLLSCERAELNKKVPPTSRPIRFSAQQQWPDVTKAAGLNDLKENGFQVWAAWNKDPQDNSSFLDDYEDGFNGSVFSATPVSFINGGWSYVTDSEYEREWYRGYYAFAALPESAFEQLVQTAEHSVSISVEEDVPSYTNRLHLKFQQELDLSVLQDQADFLFAFDCQDNSANSAEVVNLDFKHAFTRFRLEFFVYNPLKMPVVTSVKIYGNRKAVNNGETFVLTQTSVGDDNVISAQFDGVRSSSEEPYYQQSFDQSLFAIGITDSAVLCEMMVFPENLTEEHPLYIDVTYKKILESDGRYYISDDSYTYTIRIKDVVWESGETYTYKFEVDGLVDKNE